MVVKQQGCSTYNVINLISFSVSLVTVLKHDDFNVELKLN